MNARIAIAAFAGALVIASWGDARAQAHPFLIVKEELYAGLQAKAASSPWAEMKASALADCASLDWNDGGTKVSAKGYLMTGVVSSCALSYILDAPARAGYAAKIRDNLMRWGVLHANRDTPNQWDYTVPAGAAFFNSVLALDIVHDALTADERAAIEAELQTVADWYAVSGGDWEPNQHGVLGIWALYRGDEAALATQMAEYRTGLFGHFTADGVAPEGSGYATSRFEGNGERDAKTHFMDVLEFTGRDRYYDDPRLALFYEWLYGYAETPFGHHVSVGDTSPHVEGINKNGASAGRAHLISATAAAYAALRNGGAPFPGRLLHYLLMDEPLPAPKAPSSRVFPTGGAMLIEEGAGADGLYGVLWSCTESEPHSHKETNALSLAAYGEHVLRNAGYAGYGKAALGFDYSWINMTAASGNTVRIDGVDHDPYKKGAGVGDELLTGMGLDCATGDSGTALPNGRHWRTLCLVHPDGALPGYFAVLDDVAPRAAGESIDLTLHPNAVAVEEHAALDEYRAAIGPLTLSGHDVSLAIFFGTRPASVAIKDGVLAEFYDQSVVGKYVEAHWPNDGARRRMVTVLLPSDEAHPPPVPTRVEAEGVTGVAVDHADGTSDRAIEADDRADVTLDGVWLWGRNAIYRRGPAGTLDWFYVRKATQFDDHLGERRGIHAGSRQITAFFRGTDGWVISEGVGSIQIDYPGVTGALVDGAPHPLIDHAPDWASLALPAGLHAVRLLTGGSAPDGGGGGDGPMAGDSGADDDATAGIPGGSPAPGAGVIGAEAPGGGEGGCGCTTINLDMRR